MAFVVVARNCESRPLAKGLIEEVVADEEGCAGVPPKRDPTDGFEPGWVG